MLAATLSPAALTAIAVNNSLSVKNLEFHRSGGNLHVSAQLVLDSVKLGSNHQIFVTPVVTAPGMESVDLPSVLVNGRNMHYSYERGTISGDILNRYDIATEVMRHNGKPQSVDYSATVPLQKWMYGKDARIELTYDTCGCGRAAGKGTGTPLDLNLNPGPMMRVTYLTPEVTELPVAIHEGKARVQFEVDRTELHPEPYVCRNGQRIDNRAQLSMIEDSIRYATEDPNVEIARIDICGYASPESPYMHNDFLATNRSRALAEYIGERFRLPAEKCTYSSVPENWKEFRQQVVDAKDITDRQRADLLELIDAPAYGAADYDAKERTLKTDKRFAELYRTVILPKWFPQLRATKFAISTRLKPASDEKLAEIILTSPEKMSLNQMFRVARLYPEGSDEFNRTIETALKYYPESPVANLNAAVTAIKKGDFTRAATLLEKAGDSPEAQNARGVVATHNADFDKAIEYFDKAGALPEATKNRNLLD